jgi:cold shock protein
LAKTTGAALKLGLLIPGDTDVAMGIVKWFNLAKGYGFIRPENGGHDIFVHISAVEKAGYSGLAEGARVSYELFAGRNGKMSAENLRIG